MHVDLSVGHRRRGRFNSYELQVLATDWAPVLGQARLFHTTVSPHKADPEVLRAALPELHAVLQRMESLSYHTMAAPPTRRLGEPPPPAWLYDNLFRLIAVFGEAIRLGLSCASSRLVPASRKDHPSGERSGCRHLPAQA